MNSLTKPALSRCYGVDADGTLRFNDSDRRAHEVLGGQSYTGLSCDYYHSIPSTMPYAPNDYQQPEAPEPEASLSPNLMKTVWKCLAGMAVLFASLYYLLHDGSAL